MDNKIVIDAAEKPYVFKVFDRLKIPYIKERILVPEACEKIPLRHSSGELICVNKKDFLIFKKRLRHMFDNFGIDNLSCNDCPHEPIQVGDFTNENRSFLIERKRVDDYYASMADGRLYEQARKLYSYCSGFKAVILEGMSDDTVYIVDNNNPFHGYNETIKDLKGKSPLEQLLIMHPDKEDWIWGTIKDLASCEVALIQSWSTEQTARIIEYINEGAGEEPKIRAIPKKVAGLSLEETMLTVIPRIGKVRAKELIEHYGSLKST